MKLTKILIILSLLSLMMFSCGGDGDHELVGSWTRADDGSSDYESYVFTENLTFTSSNVTLTAAEVCIDENDDFYGDWCQDWSCSSTGTWSVDEDQLTFEFPVVDNDDDDIDDSEDCTDGPITVTYAIDGNELTVIFIEDEDGGVYTSEFVYTRD